MGLALSLSLGMAACGGDNSGSDSGKASSDGNASTTAKGDTSGGEKTPGNHDKFKIAVIEVQVNDESVIKADYLKNYIAPRYNCEFMFSEAIVTLDAAMTFIENAADAGCDAVINYYPVAANTEQLVQLCNEYDMVYVENGVMNKTNEGVFKAGYENLAGGFMADQPATGKLFYDYLKENLTTDETHGFVVATGSAYQGNAQQTEISTSMLKALSEIYGLTYTSTIQELISSSSPIMAENDKGIEIYCYPGGVTVDGYLEGLSAAIQTGKYDYLLMSPNNLGSVENVVDEVENALNKNINIIGFGSFGDALKTSINSKDKFGNQVLSMSTVKFTSLVSAMGFAKVYNVLTGHREAVVDKDGIPSVWLFSMQAVTDPAMLETMSSWDKDGAWVADYDVVDGFLGEMNDGLTNDMIQERIYDVTYDSILARLGS